MTDDQINKNIGRRKFFSRLGKTALITTLMSSMPVALFSGDKKFNKVKVKINPSAVKRIK